MQMYDCPFWATFKQIQVNCGTVKKGEKSTIIVFWKFIEYDTGKIDKEGNPLKEERPFLRYYRVFNLEQTEGIPWQKLMGMYDEQDNDPITECEKVVNNYKDKPEIRHSGGRAYYSPINDYVQVPNIRVFKSSEGYYNTLFHELVHSTGHVSRCNRKNSDVQAVYGGENYIKEELVAEIGSTFLCGITGIEREIIDNSTAYIQSWLRALRNDVKMVVHAAGQAQKAVDYITGR